MSTLTTEGFINKRDAAELFNRFHRSLSRDISTAVRTRDVEALQHFRLQTQDSEVREGTEVTIEILDQLRDAGQVPTWWGEQDYLHQKYGLRGEETPNHHEASATASRPDSSPRSTHASADSDELTLPSNPELRAIVLEHLHHNDQQHARDTKAMMDRILQLIETNQQLQAQTNALFNQFQETLKEGGGLRSLFVGSPSTTAGQSPEKVQPVTVAEVVPQNDIGDSPQPIRQHTPLKPNKVTAKKVISTKKKISSKKPEPVKRPSIWKRDVRDLFGRRSSR